MAKFEQEVHISPSLIKLVTGQFDLGSVLTLPLCGLGVKHIENLEGLVTLTVLDLSSNAIARVNNLEPLGGCLLRLDLRFNNISRLEGLHTLQVLEVIKLQGNNINDIDTVVGLAGMPRLRAVHLKDMNGSNANPVCNGERYRATIIRKMPRLGNLDGEFFIFDSLRHKVITDGEGDDIVIKESTRWLPKSVQNTDFAINPKTFLSSATATSKTLLDECRAVISQADLAIERQHELRKKLQENPDS